MIGLLQYMGPVKAVSHLNTLRPRQNGRHFADNIFKCIFLNENVRISLKISLNFVPNVPINNIPALVQIMAWRRLGDKPLSEPMVVSLLMHICVTRPQCVKGSFVIEDVYLAFLFLSECPRTDQSIANKERRGPRRWSSSWKPDDGRYSTSSSDQRCNFPWWSCATMWVLCCMMQNLQWILGNSSSLLLLSL